MTGSPDAATQPAQVLWLTEHHPPSRGGMAQSSDRITRSLRGAGVLVDTVHLARQARTERTQTTTGGAHLVVPLTEDPEHGLATAWLAIRRHAAAAGRAYTHVVAFGGVWALTAGPVVSAWLGVPLVSLLRGVDFDTGVWSVRRRAVLRDALTASATVCSVATSTAEQVHALFGVPSRAVLNSIDTTDWEVLGSDRRRAEQWRAEHVPAGRHVLGLIGQLKAKKGAVDLLETLRRSPVADRFHVLMVGDLEPTLEEWLTTEATDLSWTRLGFTDRHDLAWVYAACDLVALPSLHDGMPNVALEAAALGVPLLASDAGGLGDLQRLDAVAYGFAAGDRAGLLRALVEAGEASGDELDSAGQRARAVVTSELTVQRELDGYLDVLRETAR